MPLEDVWSEPATDGVVHGVTGYGGNEEAHVEDDHVERALAGECASREQERVTWQDARNHEARLAEDREEHQSVGDRSEGVEDGHDVLIEV